jgi:AAA+ superfamily predicted ATPase
MGEFLTWIEEHKIICTLLLGVPGSSKSHSIYCIGGEDDKPIINYDPSAMEDKLVGEGGKHMRNANRTVESISDGKVWLIATANSLRGLPPELISRFQVGGIFFFDCPDDRERKGIMELKVKKYGLQDQPFPDMDGWVGRDIDNCARKAALLSMTLIEAAAYVVPLMKSHSEEIDALRMSAHDRFLSASNSGVYQYSAPPAKIVVHTPIVNAGRKIR